MFGIVTHGFFAISARRAAITVQRSGTICIGGIGKKKP
jgi:hypothetical protein